MGLGVVRELLLDRGQEFFRISVHLLLLEKQQQGAVIGKIIRSQFDRLLEHRPAFLPLLLGAVDPAADIVEAVGLALLGVNLGDGLFRRREIAGDELDVGEQGQGIGMFGILGQNPVDIFAALLLVVGENWNSATLTAASRLFGSRLAVRCSSAKALRGSFCCRYRRPSW